MIRDAEVESIAREIFADASGSRNFDRIEVTSGVDHDGDPSFFVTVHFKPGVNPVDIDASSAAHVLLLQRFHDLGEDRFPYMRYRFAGDEELIGDDEAETT